MVRIEVWTHWHYLFRITRALFPSILVPKESNDPRRRLKSWNEVNGSDATLLKNPLREARRFFYIGITLLMWSNALVTSLLLVPFLPPMIN